MTRIGPTFLENPPGFPAIETSAFDLRTTYGTQPGVYGSGDLAVTAAAGLAVSVAAGIGFVAGTEADERFRLQSTAAIVSSAIERITGGVGDGNGIAAAHATLPRVDRLIAKVYDHSVDGSGRREWVPQILTGTPTTGDAVDNATGAVAPPAMSIALADLLISPNATSVSAIRDRRPWARGAHVSAQDTAGNLTLSSTTFVELHSRHRRRIECSGNPITVALTGSGQLSAGGVIWLAPIMDGLIFPAGDSFHAISVTGAAERGFNVAYTFTPAAGSHLFSWGGKAFGPTLTIFAISGRPLNISIDERIRPSANNGTA